MRLFFHAAIANGPCIFIGLCLLLSSCSGKKGGGEIAQKPALPVLEKTICEFNAFNDRELTKVITDTTKLVSEMSSRPLTHDKVASAFVMVAKENNWPATSILRIIEKGQLAIPSALITNTVLESFNAPKNIDETVQLVRNCQVNR